MTEQTNEGLHLSRVDTVLNRNHEDDLRELRLDRQILEELVVSRQNELASVEEQRRALEETLEAVKREIALCDQDLDNKHQGVLEAKRRLKAKIEAIALAEVGDLGV